MGGFDDRIHLVLRAALCEPKPVGLGLLGMIGF